MISLLSLAVLACCHGDGTCRNRCEKSTRAWPLHLFSMDRQKNMTAWCHADSDVLCRSTGRCSGWLGGLATSKVNWQSFSGRDAILIESWAASVFSVNKNTRPYSVRRKRKNHDWTPVMNPRVIVPTRCVLLQFLLCCMSCTSLSQAPWPLMDACQTPVSFITKAALQRREKFLSDCHTWVDYPSRQSFPPDLLVVDLLVHELILKIIQYNDVARLTFNCVPRS